MTSKWQASEYLNLTMQIAVRIFWYLELSCYPTNSIVGFKFTKINVLFFYHRLFSKFETSVNNFSEKNILCKIKIKGRKTRMVERTKIGDLKPRLGIFPHNQLWAIKYSIKVGGLDFGLNWILDGLKLEYKALFQVVFFWAKLFVADHKK